MNPKDASSGTVNTSRLEHFPVSIFATTMGLSGLTLVWIRAAHIFKLGAFIPALLAALTAAVFAFIATVYVLKALRHPANVLEEYHHPVRLNFIPAISISALLLSVALQSVLPAAAQPLFFLGAGLHFVLTLSVLNAWLNRDGLQFPHLNPAWFIPIVGNIIVPLAAVPLGYVELSWFFFSVGFMFWLVLFTLNFNRILFHPALPPRLAPTIFILIAPPAVGFLSYVRLIDSIDGAARILYYFALFLTAFLFTQLPRLLRLPFFLSWWAYSFPMAAVTIASLVMYERIGGTGFLTLSVILVTVTTALITALSLRTLIAARNGQICVPE